MDKATQEFIVGYLAKAEQKLRVAEKLFKGGDWEDAVSRAYYAAFHAAQALLLSEDLRADTHKGVVMLFGLHFVKTGKFNRKFAEHLTNLKDDREAGDYDAFTLINEQTAANALHEAQEFVAEARQYLKAYLK